MNDSVEALEIKVSFQDELLQQLDEALGQQQQEILLLKEQLRVLSEQVRLLGDSEAKASVEPPPPPLLSDQGALGWAAHSETTVNLEEGVLGLVVARLGRLRLAHYSKYPSAKPECN